MAKTLSERLAELSVRTKKVEDSVQKYETETRDELISRRDQVRASTVATLEKIHGNVKSAESNLSSRANEIKTKLSDDIAGLRAQWQTRKAEFDHKVATRNAELLEDDAAYAIDYALASIDQAEAAVLDAIVARAEANRA